GIMGHGIQAEGDIVVDHTVEIGGGALGQIRAERYAAGAEIVGFGRLAHQVEAAAGGAATTKGAARTLRDLDLLEIEGFAAKRAGVPDAIDIGIGECIKAADEGPVADG